MLLTPDVLLFTYVYMLICMHDLQREGNMEMSSVDRAVIDVVMSMCLRRLSVMSRCRCSCRHIDADVQKKIICSVKACTSY